MRAPTAPRRALALVAAAVALSVPGDASALCGTRTGQPVGGGECPGVRPGAVLRSGTETCTFGFVFQGSDRRRYVATAGHCAFDPDPATNPGRTQTWKVNAGPVVKDADGRQVGRFAYATVQGQFADFALVRLDHNVVSSPEVCHFGGPTGLNTEVHNRDMLVHHFGHGSGMETFPARTGEAFFGLYRADYVYFYGASSAGDSGGPVTDERGAAIGLVTDLTTPFTGNVGVNRLSGHLAAASKALKVRLTLLTAPPR